MAPTNSAGMSVITALRDYVTKMITNTSGMKVFLLDKDTTGIISMVYMQSEILSKEVYLVERVGVSSREKMSHLQAICFLRPTNESVSALCAELKNPKYGGYFIYFSNILDASHLERLAESDNHELVKEVQEFYGDYYAVNTDLFSLNIPRCMRDGSAGWDSRELERSVDGLVSLLLSLRMKPVIRYQKSSDMCKTLATDVMDAIRRESSLFDFRRSDVPPLLLILDRRDDPVTPLLNQWTYQAMVHELMGINNNRVNLSNVAGVREELKEIVLSSEQDDFYRRNMFLNFGDICVNIKELVDKFQHKTKINQNIESIDDMKRFIEDYPQFRQMSGNVSKHVTVVGELSKMVDVRSLLEVSEVEQELACNADHSSILQRIRMLLDDNNVADLERLRLVMLYALRYERNSSNDIQGLTRTLLQRGIPESDIRAVQAMLDYAGASVRSSDIYEDRTISAFAKKALKGLKGVSNMYTQHKPLLQGTLDALYKGKLKEAAFPFLGSSLRDRPQDVIVFMVGGTTFEEARTVDELNRSLPGIRIVLGGTCIHNARSFIKVVENSGHSSTNRRFR